MKRGKRDNWRQSHEEEQEQTNTNKSQLLPPLSFHLQQRQQYKLYSDKRTRCYLMQGAGVLSSRFTVSSTQQNTEIESISRRIQQQIAKQVKAKENTQKLDIKSHPRHRIHPSFVGTARIHTITSARSSEERGTQPRTTIDPFLGAFFD